MNLDLPEQTSDLAELLRRRLDGLSSAPASQVADVLDELGVLDMLTDDSPDPDNRHVNAYVALRELAYAGISGAYAETMWARAYWPEDRRPELTGLVAIPCEVEHDGKRLVPFGMAAAGVAIAGPSGAHAFLSVPNMLQADVRLQEGHAWADVPSGSASFEELDAPYCWRAAAAGVTGYMEAALALAVTYARTRVQFGRPIGAFQSIQFRLAQCQWRLSGLELLVREAAWRADRNDPLSEPLSALAWLYARQVGRLVTAHAHQVFGAIGFTQELGLTRLTSPVTFQRAVLPAAAAAALVWAARDRGGTEPASSVLTGFATKVPVVGHK